MVMVVMMVQLNKGQYLNKSASILRNSLDITNFKMIVVLCSAVILNFCRNEANETYINGLTYSAEILDSIIIKSNNFVEYIDIDLDKSKILFFEEGSRNIIEAELDGTIINELTPWGKGEDDIGEILASMTYSSSGEIIVSTERGYFSFDSDRDSKILLKDKKDFPVQLWRRGVELSDGELFLFVDDLFYDPRKASYQPNSREYYADLKMFSLFNKTEKSKKFALGVESGSLFMSTTKDQFYYPDLYPFYTAIDDGLAILINPDHRVYLYDTNLTLKGEIQVSAEHFKRLENSELRDMPIMNVWNVNSSYCSLTRVSDNLLLCYREGETESEIQIVNRGEFKDDSDKYCFFVNLRDHDGDKSYQSESFRIPNKINEILTPLGDNIFLASHNYNMIEHQEGTIFYLLRIRELVT